MKSSPDLEVSIPTDNATKLVPRNASQNIVKIKTKREGIVK